MPTDSKTDVCLPLSLRKPRLRRWEASEYLELVHGLRFAPATLAKLACIGGGPVFHRVNSTPLYPRCGDNGLDDWATNKLGAPVRSTSEAAARRCLERRGGGPASPQGS